MHNFYCNTFFHPIFVINSVPIYSTCFVWNREDVEDKRSEKQVQNSGQVAYFTNARAETHGDSGQEFLPTLTSSSKSMNTNAPARPS